MWKTSIHWIAVLLLLSLSAEAAAADSAVCKLTPLHTGVCQIGKDHVLGEAYTAEERMSFVIYAFLVEGPRGERALIDLGPKTLEYTNRMFRRYGFFRDLGADHPTETRYPDDIVQPHGNVFDHLSRLGVAAESIDHIVFTHFHADHHGMNDATDGGAAEDFFEALLHVSAAGWNDNLTRRQDGRWNSYVDHAFSDFLLRRQQQGKLRAADNAEIFPGLRTLYLGGHSVCSQAVIVDTAAGPALIASDDVYLYQLLEDNILPQIRTSESKYRAALERVTRLAVAQRGVIVPLHDPLVWQAHQDAGADWLSRLRPVSDRAVKRYLARDEAAR